MKKVSIIGSTGSVGQKALLTAKNLNYQIEAITAKSNLLKLAQQNEQFNPKYIGVIDESVYDKARELFGKKLVFGKEALTFSCALDVDIVVISVTGLSGIYPLIEALRNGKLVALANKESVVAGGELLTRLFGNGLADPYSDCPRLIPLDSEHSAVFQCLKAGKKTDVEKLILTASGGAFYDYNIDRLKKISPRDIYHPNWQMGRKITVDSSTMMNKALEIVEAAWLFDCRNIDYVVHKESIIHSMVQFKDGSMMAQLCKPDMSLPIQYALTYPNRIVSNLSDFELSMPLSVCKKNSDLYAPDIAFRSLQIGGLAGAVMNAANEAAVALFEEGKIGFLDIVSIVDKCVNSYPGGTLNSLEDITQIHNETIYKVTNFYNSIIG